MKRLVRAELLKMSTVRTFRGVVLGAVALAILRFGMVVSSAGKIEASPLGTGASTRDLMLAAGTGAIFFLVIGVLVVVTEFRHGTIGPTFLTTPRRGRVLAAKVMAVALVASAYLIVVSALMLGMTVVLFTSRDIPLDTINGELLAALAGVAIGMPLYGVIGVGLGAIIRHQVAALMIPLGWLLVVENLLPSFGLLRLLAWLPGGATAALGRQDLPGLLPMWAGALLLLGYALAAVGAGSRVIARRDVM